jgi:hypothetical protein
MWTLSELGLKKLPSMVTVSPQALATPIGESLMILDLTSGVYYELEGVGSRIWQLLAGEMTPAQVAHQISVEYRVSEASVVSDLADLIGELSASGLRAIPANPTEPEPWQV